MPSDLEELNDRPEAKNLIGIYSSLTNSSLIDSIKNFSGKNFSEFKEDLSQVLVDKIGTISIEIRKLLKESNYLDEILLKEQQKAEELASKQSKKNHDKVGI